MNVLSCFDGISCGRVALEKIGIRVDKYYASEIDKFASAISEKNYPDIKRLGDINEWEAWDLPKIDLLLGGFSCQSFSFAGSQLNFDDPRGKLFFVLANIFDFYKPKYFLFENVMMKQEYQDIISERIGVKPIMLNSGRFSAQNRKRLYWTNIPLGELPEDKGLVMDDILEKDLVNPKLYPLSQGYFPRYKDGLTFSKDGLCHIADADIKGNQSIKRVYSSKGKCPTLTTMGGGHREPKIALDENTWRKLTPVECNRLQCLPEGYSEGFSNSQQYKTAGNGWTVDVIAYIMKGLRNG